MGNTCKQSNVNHVKLQSSEINLSSFNADCLTVSVSVICICENVERGNTITDRTSSTQNLSECLCICQDKSSRFQAAACPSGNEAAQKAAKHRQPLPTHMHLQHITQEGTFLNNIDAPWVAVLQQLPHGVVSGDCIT